MTIRRQSRIKGGRMSLPTGLDPRIYKRIDQLAHRFSCTRAFVASSLFARALHEQLEEYFDKEERPRLRRVK